MIARLLAGVLVAPVVALLLGVWAEFADLGPPLLLGVAVPAIAISAGCAAGAIGVARRPVFVVAIGTLLGALTFALTEGTWRCISRAAAS